MHTLAHRVFFVSLIRRLTPLERKQPYLALSGLPRLVSVLRGKDGIEFHNLVNALMFEATQLFHRSA